MSTFPSSGIWHKVSRYSGYLIMLVLLAGLAAISFHNYLLFHGLAELFGVIILFSLFYIVWKNRENITNNFLLIFGSASLFIGIIQILHTMSYQGMGVFSIESSNQATQLWLAGRYLEASGILLAVWFLGHPKAKTKTFITIFGALCLLLILSIFVWKIFPAAYVDGVGLTQFKIFSEYVISALFLLSAFWLYKKRSYFDKRIFLLLIAAIGVTIVAEMAFTFYISVVGFSNLVGHIIKLFGYYFIYKALIMTGVLKPQEIIFRELKISENKFRALFNNSPFGIFICEIIDDQEGKPVDFVHLQGNPSVETNIGFKLDQIIGKKASEMVSDGVLTDLMEKYTNVVINKQILRYEQYFDIYDRHLSVTAYPLAGNKFVLIFTDITERRRAEENQRRLNEYQELDRLKNTLLSVVSHELRTPLASIKGYSSMLLHYGQSLTDRQKKISLQAIDRSTERLVELIDHLLDTSRLDAGLLKLNMEPGKLSSIIKTAVKDGRMRKQHHSIVTKDIPDLPKVNIDIKRIREVVDNLLDNAVKYSPEGSEITVRAQILPEYIQVSVADKGVGIAEEEQEKIFGRMYRIEQRLSDDPGGLGLGLNLCKAIIEAHGGTIWVESKLGEGSTFYFTLPRYTGDESDGEK